MEDGVFLNKKHGEMGNWITVHDYEGQVLVGVGEAYDFISRPEAISLARAILKHYEVE